MKQVILPGGPHLRTAQTTRNMMFHVALSLVPALLGAIYFFGIRALYLTALSVAVCVITEYLWQKLTGKQKRPSGWSLPLRYSASYSSNKCLAVSATTLPTLH